MIKHVSLAHGWYYHYRIHSDKTEELCKHKYYALKTFLNNIMKKCPDEKFTSGPRSNSLSFPIKIKLKKHYEHEVSKLCFQGLKSMNNYRTSHSKVQMFMLQYDKNTISVEVPIWMQPQEIRNFQKLFNSQDPLSGHIDLLRIEKDQKIWIWDYKPKAEKEKYATTQIYFYALMTSFRTGISLENFRCGYFDEQIAYTFKPTLETVKNLCIKY